MRRDRRAVTKPNDFKKSLKQLLSLMMDFKLKLLLTFICAVLGTSFTVIGPLLIGKATTIIYDGIVRLSNGSGTIDVNTLYFLLTLAVILYVLSALFTYLQSYFLTQISTQISYNLRKRLIEKLNQLSMDSIDAHKRGDILSRITNDVDSLQTGITSTFLQFMTAIITLIGVFIMMLSINIWMTLITLVLLPISFIIITQVVKRSQDYYKQQLKYKGNVNTHIEETFGGQDIIRAYNHEKRSFDSFKDDNDKWYVYEWKSQFFSSLMGPIMNFISNLSYIAIAVVGAIFVLEGVIVVGDIMAFFQYIQNFTQPIQQITRVMNIVQTALAACERIFEFLKLDNEENPSDKKITDIKSDISFENVSFSYSDKKVINDLSFRADKGQKIAIVGHTGAGKSTIVKLLMHFYDLDSGVIRIDGVDINEYDKNSLRSMVAMLLQDTWLFSDTIMENIRYGNLDASDEEVINASKIAYADNFIMQLPDNYSTVLNEDSDNISVGQKQLLAIARIILSDKKILILDEATSSVDTRTEKLIQDAMDKMMENRTSFVIAHRLSTIKNADKILVMDEGRIIEEGTHDELITKAEGYYKSLYNQFESIGYVK